MFRTYFVNKIQLIVVGVYRMKVYRKYKIEKLFNMLLLVFFLCRNIENVAQDTAQIVETPKIALTFDDGPSIYTEELLDGLKQRGVKATFFVIGKCAEVYPKIVEREAKEGHIVGNHTYNHVEITKLSVEDAREEIEKTNEILEKLTHKRSEYVRPPFGVWEEELEDLQMMSVMWTIDTLDWTTENTDEIVNKVVTQAEENDIILMHDCYKSSVQAALRIVDLLQAEGFCFVTVDELLID